MLLSQTVYWLTNLTPIAIPGTSVPEISRTYQVTVITACRTAAVVDIAYLIVLAVAWITAVNAEIARL